MRSRIGITIAALAAVATLVAGCSSTDTAADSTNSNGADAGAASGSSAEEITGTVTVLAAASLTETFTTLGKQFEAAHPGVTVKFSFAASSALAEQANNGAPADVFASASVKNMTLVTEAKNADTPTIFVKNAMQIAVPASNPANITTLADLAKPGVKVALCQAEVPCGATAQKVFDNAKLKVTPVTLEEDVKSTLAKVELNEVDAAVVYVTDVKAAGDKIKGIEIDPAVNASTEYPIATLTNAPNAVGGKAFMEYVLSAEGQQVLADAGFAKP